MSSVASRSLWPPGTTLLPAPDAGLVELRAEIRAFLAEELAAGRFVPVANSWMTGHDPAFSRRLAERGWIGMVVPVEYGGHGQRPLARHIVLEELLAAGAPVAAHWTGDRQTSLSLLTFGTEEQRRTFLPQICAGTFFVCIGMSEPDAGSDLAAVRLRAERVFGGWRLSGTKVWTSGAQHASAIVILARTGPSGPSRHEGLTQFFVELPAQGLTVRPILLQDGTHHFNEVHLDNVFVADHRVLGTVGEAWAQMMAELSWERGGPERFLSTLPLADQLLDDSRYDDATVGEVVARTWVLSQLARSVATTLEGGRHPELEAAILKDLGTEFEVELTTTLVESAITSVDDDPLADTRLAGIRVVTPFFTLRGGASEILREVVTRQLGDRWDGTAR
ncbi:MAG TPA: acyl-CoA dehydrogenase family protein [Jatrophihabitantaceae bacterium]